VIAAALAHYPAAVAGLAWVPLGAAGGFSGASLFRGDSAAGPQFALKAWPPGVTAAALAVIHAHMHTARAGGCDFVPAVVPTRSGATAVAAGGRAFDLTAWVPGTAAADPTDAQLDAIGHAVAALHRAWRGVPAAGPIPAVTRRLAALEGVDVPAVLAKLRPWAEVVGPVQPTVGDLRLEHVLFTGDRVTGIVDYGAVKPDHAAADLARLAADLPPGRLPRLVAAYNARAADAVPAGLVAALAHAGLVGAVRFWARSPDPRGRERLAFLTERLRGWS